MAGFFFKGITLHQHKEPALSRDLREFFNADTMGLQMDCPPVEHPDELTYEEIIRFARMASIVDERDGAPLADKLEQARQTKVNLLVIDAIDDEPYISSQLNPVLKNIQLATDGITFCQKACGANEAYFAMHKSLTDIEIRLPRRIGNFPVVRLSGRYPAEYQASKEYDEDEHVLVIGSGALLHLARAILYRKPQTTVFITVAGDCIGNPTNLEVSLGMTVTQALERCGLIDDPQRVVVGGSMTGISVIDTDTTQIRPTTRAILAFREDLKSLNLSCIGCGRCVHVCPEGLNPLLLHRSVLEKKFDVFRKLDAHLCVGCGTCSYMCPAKLNLSEIIFGSASRLQHITGAMEQCGRLEQIRESAEYDRYLGNFRLGKAIQSHRQGQRDLLRTYQSKIREAAGARAAADSATNRMLQEAQRTLESAGREAERRLQEAQRTMNEAVSAADRMVSDSEKSRDTIRRETDKALDGALKAKYAAESTADKTYLAFCKEQEGLVQFAVREAQRELTRLEKAKEPAATPEQLNTAQKNCNTARVQGEERCKRECDRTRQNCDRAKADAQAAYEQAQVLCRKTVEDGERAVEKAREDAVRQKEAAHKAYEAAQVVCDQEKQAAQKVWDAEQETGSGQRAVTLAVYEAAMETIRLESLEAQRAVDATLREARLSALEYTFLCAQARAVQTRRALRDRDYELPSYLLSSEKELLRRDNRLPVEVFPDEPAPDPQENIRNLIFQWREQIAASTDTVSKEAVRKTGEEVHAS